MIKPILFSSGDIFATPGAVGLGVDLMPYLFRHLTGDWVTWTSSTGSKTTLR